MASNIKKPYSIDEDESLQVPTTSDAVTESVERAQLVQEPETDLGDIGSQDQWDRALSSIQSEVDESQPEELEAMYTPPSPIQTEELNLDMPQTPVPQMETAAAVAPADLTKYSAPVSKRNQILDNYKALRLAQDEQNNRLNTSNMLMAGNQIAQAIASGHGAQIGDGSAAVSALRSQASVPVDQAKDNIKYGNEMEMADPESDVSMFYRENAYAILKKIYPEKTYDLSNLSAAQIAKIPGLGKALENKAGINKPVGFGMFINAKTNAPIYFDQETKKMYYATTGQEVGPNDPIARPIGYNDPVTGGRGYLTSNGMSIPGVGAASNPNRQIPTKADGSQKVDLAEIRRLDPNAFTQFNDVKKVMLTDMKAVRDDAAAAVTLSSKLVPGPNGEIDSGLLGGIQTQAAKLAGQKGVLTDQDLVKFAGAGGVEAKINRIIDGSLFGEMTEDDIKFFKRFAQLMTKSIGKIIENDAQIHIANGLDAIRLVYPGATENDARELLKVGKLAPVAQGTETVTLVHKSGQSQKVTKEKAQEYLDKYPNDFKVQE